MISLPFVISPPSCASIASSCSQRLLLRSSMLNTWTGIEAGSFRSRTWGEEMSAGKQAVFGVRTLGEREMSDERRRCLVVAANAFSGGWVVKRRGWW
jgi:hypothetical protein